MSGIDPRTPCLIGVARHTWHRADTGEVGAPEPLLMWEQVARAAALDAGVADLLGALDSIQIVYCQTWQYDDPVERLAQRIGAAPKHRHYSGIGGTTTQQLVASTAEAMLRGELDLALVTSAEALATQRAHKQRGERPSYSFRPAEKRPFPWEAPMHPAEVAHEVFQAWLTFALFDNARRARLGLGLDEYRDAIGELLAPMTHVAAASEHAWFPVERSATELVTVRPDNRMVGYPYTKYTVSVMDVDMAAALVVATHERADALGVPQYQRVYLRGWAYATDPTYVAEHHDLSRSPAMGAAAREALRGAGVSLDDVAHFDLYSCFASSVHFALDALGLAADDTRPLTVTGGLPYHGGPGSGYLTHSIAAMVEVLRRDPGACGLVSGVGMHMTKHAYGVYSTTPGPVAPPDSDRIAVSLPSAPPPTIVDEYDGAATVAAYSVVHGRDGAPEWGLVVADLADGARAYAKVLDPALLADAERHELVGRTVRVAPRVVPTALGEGRANIVSGS
ncbi:MAG TPA: acetyl-CoA acetyltransferase [Acidimicrobiia bacterium]|nr:acetyl-CoA acetyltransferase [Acidimicrobiia bacterium]